MTAEKKAGVDGAVARYAEGITNPEQYGRELMKEEGGGVDLRAMVPPTDSKSFKGRLIAIITKLGG